MFWCSRETAADRAIRGVSGATGDSVSGVLGVSVSGVVRGIFGIVGLDCGPPID